MNSDPDEFIRRATLHAVWNGYEVPSDQLVPALLANLRSDNLHLSCLSAMHLGQIRPVSLEAIAGLRERAHLGDSCSLRVLLELDYQPVADDREPLLAQLRVFSADNECRAAELLSRFGATVVPDLLARLPDGFATRTSAFDGPR